MAATLKEIIGLAKEIPEEYFDEVYNKLADLKDKDETESNTKVCPHCKSNAIVRNGKRHGKQAYICRKCSKTFVETTASAIEYSHTSATVWKEVIRDTVDGVFIDKTAKSLDLSHDHVFHMRHKILYLRRTGNYSLPYQLRRCLRS
jgi:transposase-like protein